MFWSKPKSTLQIIESAASSRHIIRIRYRKTDSDLNPPHRLAEPYSMSQGRQDIMLKAYQIEPENGYRFFVLQKIVDVVDTGNTFTPRRAIRKKTIKDCENNIPDNWPDRMKAYQGLVMGILADSIVTAQELRAAETCRQTRSISDNERRLVHECLYMDCFRNIMADGAIDDEERSALISIDKNLSLLGDGGFWQGNK